MYNRPFLHKRKQNFKWSCLLLLIGVVGTGRSCIFGSWCRTGLIGSFQRGMLTAELASGFNWHAAISFLGLQEIGARHFSFIAGCHWIHTGNVENVEHCVNLKNANHVKRVQPTTVHHNKADEHIEKKRTHGVDVRWPKFCSFLSNFFYRESMIRFFKTIR